MSIAFDLDRYYARMRDFDGARFSVEEAAIVPYRDRTYPVLAVRSKVVAPKTLLVLAGIHGDEPAGLLAIPPILEAWTSERVRLIVITPLNPVGAAKNSRVNAGGQDINRDFLRFTTPEARVVRDVFEEARPDFVISLHEGPQRGTFMFANHYVERPLAIALCDALAAGGTVLSERDYFGRRLRPPGLAEASAITRTVWKIGAVALRKQATIVYSQDRAVPEIVLESSTRQDEAARVRPHVDLVLAVAQRL